MFPADPKLPTSPLYKAAGAIAGLPLSQPDRAALAGTLGLGPVCGPDSPMGRATAAMNATAIRLLAPLHRANAVVAQQLAPWNPDLLLGRISAMVPAPR